MNTFRYRLLWPFTLISLCLVALCVITAVSLIRQQVTVAEVLRENVANYRAAAELEECLIDLALLGARDESVSVLYGRAETLLNVIASRPHQPGEKLHFEQLKEAFARYIEHRRAMPPPGTAGHDDAVREAARMLEVSMLRPCQDIEQSYGRRVEESAEVYALVDRRLAWQLAVVAGLGGVAGLVLGFGVARSLSRSLRNLQVRIRDAAVRLGPERSEIVVTGEGDFAGLHEQVDELTDRIESILRRLNDREREVLRAEQLAAVGQLAAGVAHEIHNPLTSIKMLVQAELENPHSEGMPREDLGLIEAEIRRLEGSLRTFLDFARPARAEFQRIEVLPHVQAVLGLIRARAEKQRVVVRLDAPEARTTIMADGGQLQQVLVNLVLNALDAMPSGGTLTIAVRAVERGVVIEVTDTGPGIAPEILPKLFQPFASSKDTGLGLGLVTSRRIVEDHGGLLTAANRSGGAVFTVTLPADCP